MKSTTRTLTCIVAILGLIQPGQSALAASLSASASAPVVDGADISQLVGAADLGGDEGHVWSNRPVQGQSFTTLGNANGYTLSSVTLKTGGGGGNAGRYLVRIGQVSGSTFSSVVVDGAPSGVAPGVNDFITFTLSEPVHLNPNTVYGFEVGARDNGFVSVNNTDVNSYTGGAAISSGINHVPNDSSVLFRTGDRVFHVNLQPAATAPGTTPAGGVISANFAGSGGNIFNVTGTAGAHVAPNWNNLTGDDGNAILKNELNVNTSASITYTSNNTWQTSGPIITGNDNLMKGYLDSNGATPPTVSVSGLDSTFTSNGYSVIVYGTFDSAGLVGYSITDSNANTDTHWMRSNENNAFNGAFVQSLATAQNQADASSVANSVRLSGFTGANFAFTFLNGPLNTNPNDGRARINGFQIVANPVPEPNSLLLIGSAAAGLAAATRRRRTR